MARRVGTGAASVDGAEFSDGDSSPVRAVEDVIQWLYAKDALGKCDSATVAMARTLAEQLDTTDSKNARLWSEYRETISVLVKAGEERRNEFDDILSNLEASLRHPPTK